jgi:two-component system CheB/CheR fusion protein
MPGMTGHELIGALRRRPHLVDVPAIALSGFGDPGDDRAPAVAAFEAHLVKPVDPAVLAACIDRIVARASIAASRTIAQSR